MSSHSYISIHSYMEHISFFINYVLIVTRERKLQKIITITMKRILEMSSTSVNSYPQKLKINASVNFQNLIRMIKILTKEKFCCRLQMLLQIFHNFRLTLNTLLIPTPTSRELKFSLRLRQTMTLISIWKL